MDYIALKWNDFDDNVKLAFKDFRDLLNDVTLYCGGQKVLANRLVLCACSEVFKSMILSSQEDMIDINRPSNPSILLWDIDIHELNLILDFMYFGEIKVKESQLTSILTLAERLKVKGLYGMRVDLGKGTVGQTQAPITTQAPHTSNSRRGRRPGSSFPPRPAYQHQNTNVDASSSDEWGAQKRQKLDSKTAPSKITRSTLNTVSTGITETATISPAQLPLQQVVLTASNHQPISYLKDQFLALTPVNTEQPVQPQPTASSSMRQQFNLYQHTVPPKGASGPATQLVIGNHSQHAGLLMNREEEDPVGNTTDVSTVRAGPDGLPGVTGSLVTAAVTGGGGNSRNDIKEEIVVPVDLEAVYPAAEDPVSATGSFTTTLASTTDQVPSTGAPAGSSIAEPVLMPSRGGGGNFYNCQLCGKSYRTLGSLKNHRSLYHRTVVGRIFAKDRVAAMAPVVTAAEDTATTAMSSMEDDNAMTNMTQSSMISDDLISFLMN